MIARERRELRRVDALGHPLERVLSALADPHLAEREPELLGQWALHVLGQLRDRAVEAEAGLDADREQVERVGEIGADLLAAPLRLQRDEVVGCDEPARAKGAHEQEAQAGARDRHDEDTHQRPADGEEALGSQKPGRRETPSEACSEQPERDRLHARSRVDLQHPLGEGLAQGLERPLA